MEGNWTKHCKDPWRIEAVVVGKRNPCDLEKKEMASWWGGTGKRWKSKGGRMDSWAGIPGAKAQRGESWGLGLGSEVSILDKGRGRVRKLLLMHSEPRACGTSKWKESLSMSLQRRVSFAPGIYWKSGDPESEGKDSRLEWLSVEGKSREISKGSTTELADNFNVGDERNWVQKRASVSTIWSAGNTKELNPNFSL